MKTLVCSDIHGEFESWQKALSKSDIDFAKGDNIIILGDLIDRGSQSYECVSFALDLLNKYPEQVIYLMGNHEKMFLDFVNVKDPKTHEGYIDLYTCGKTWIGNGGTQTISSFLGGLPDSLLDIYYLFHERFTETINKLNQLPYYYVDSDNGFAYVHAGFESNVPLNEQSKEAMIWIREEFYNEFSPVVDDELDGKLIVHGHTPVQYFDDYAGCGFYRGKHHICVDGGSARGEKVLVVNIDDMSYVEQNVQ